MVQTSADHNTEDKGLKQRTRIHISPSIKSRTYLSCEMNVSATLCDTQRLIRCRTSGRWDYIAFIFVSNRPLDHLDSWAIFVFKCAEGNLQTLWLRKPTQLRDFYCTTGAKGGWGVFFYINLNWFILKRAVEYSFYFTVL